MARVHFGFTPQEVEAAAGGNREGVDVAGAGDFATFKETLPDSAEELRSDYVPPTAAPIGEPIDVAAIEAKQRVTKKISGRMKALQEGIAQFPVDFFQKRAGVVYSERQTKMIAEAFQLTFDVLDIGVEVEPIGYRITNPWLFIFLPFALMLGFLVANKAEQQEASQPGE